MAVTIKDVADRAQVSYTSVSRALNGKKGVSEETCEKILVIAEEMGYRPNALARGLVNNRTYTLGLIIPDIINPFFPEIARGVDEAARKERVQASSSATPDGIWSRSGVPSICWRKNGSMV